MDYKNYIKALQLVKKKKLNLRLSEFSIYNSFWSISCQCEIDGCYRHLDIKYEFDKYHFELYLEEYTSKDFNEIKKLIEEKIVTPK
jgi:hypothetical protein